jgi:hypothetical protein
MYLAYKEMQFMKQKHENQCVVFSMLIAFISIVL